MEPLIPQMTGGPRPADVPDPLEQSPTDYVGSWARGDSTLKEIKGYSDSELHCVARQGYTLYLNGKFKDAQVIFEGLVAIDPRNDYYYRALGVVYHRRGDAEGAIRQFGHAMKVSPRSPNAYVNRAEVHISRRDFAAAVEDLNRSLVVAHPDHPLARKASALRSLLLRARR